MITLLHCIVLYSDLEHFCGFYALQNKLLLLLIIIFIHSSGESLCCLVVVHDRFVNCCIAMLYSGVTGFDMVQEALCFPDIPLPRFLSLVIYAIAWSMSSGLQYLR